MARGPHGIKEVTRVASINPQPRGVIDTRNQSRKEQVAYFTGGGSALDGLSPEPRDKNRDSSRLNDRRLPRPVRASSPTRS